MIWHNGLYSRKIWGFVYTFQVIWAISLYPLIWRNCSYPLSDMTYMSIPFKWYYAYADARYSICMSYLPQNKDSIIKYDNVRVFLFLNEYEVKINLSFARLCGGRITMEYEWQESSKTHKVSIGHSFISGISSLIRHILYIANKINYFIVWISLDSTKSKNFWFFLKWE